MRFEEQSKRGKWIFPLLVFLLTACDNHQQSKTTYPFIHSGQTMGTSFNIRVSSLPDMFHAEVLRQKIDEELGLINAQMSTYDTNSELSKFNSQNSSNWQTVTDNLFKVITQAQKTSELTSGAFDITVGPVVNLWGFGPEQPSYKVPDENQIQQTLNKIGYKHLKLRATPKAIKKNSTEIYLDLSALAKGFAVDQVAELLEQTGLTDYLVEIGGEMRLKGNNIQAKRWRIAIEKPTPEQRTIHKVLSISNVAMATSGDYRNFFEIDGNRFSHTIDPRTGWPVKHGVASVTVFRESTMEADALATAFMVLGAEAGLELAEQQKIAVLFIIKTDEGFKQLSSSAFTTFIR